jgi:hypothetical protein
MPDTDAEILAKVLALESLRATGERILFTEVVRFNWPAPEGARDYCFTNIDLIAGFQTIVLVPLSPVAKIITSNGQRFLKLPRTASISDDKVDVQLSDLDGEISRLCHTYGQGIKVQVFSYYPQVHLTLEDWTGTLGAPKNANGVTLKLTVTSGFRSPNLLLPNRIPATSCTFIWAGHLASQEEIDQHQGCPRNVHVGGSIGTLINPATGEPWTNCARDSVATCLAHLETTRYWPAFNTVVEGVMNNQTKGPNLLAVARGNEGNLHDPIRVVMGRRRLKALRLLAYRAENNTNHPDKGFVAAQFEVAEGPVWSLSDFRINNVFVGYQHLNVRDGALAQPPTSFSPNINSYSGTSVAFGRIQGDYRNVSASGLSGSILCEGLRDVRQYSDPESYVESYCQQPVWNVLRMLTDKRWGYGEDIARYNIPSAIETAAWHAEQVSFHDPNGNVFAGTRSTSNIELTARATQQQIYDACVAARMAVPFSFAGQKHFYPLKQETIDDQIPVFTTRGADVNICIGDGRRPDISWGYTGDDEIINQINISLDDDANFGENVTVPFGDQLQQLAAGKAWGDRTKRVVSKNYPAFGITNISEAARLANLLLYLGPLDSGGILNNLRVTFTTWLSQALRIRPYQLIRLIVPELEIYGFDYFRVMKITRGSDLRVELEVQAYPVDFYAQMEADPPPLVTSELLFNPGGHAGSRPYPVGFDVVTMGKDTINFTLTL